VALLGTTSGSGKWEGEGGHAGQSSAVRLMVCHACGFQNPAPEKCPECTDPARTLARLNPFLVTHLLKP
jgi:hypothetical protein